MRSRISWVSTAVVVAGLVLAGPAGAVTTIGSTTQPSGSTPTLGCGPGDVIAQATSDAATPYIVPAGGGRISQWQINTAGATAGTSVTFVVLKFVSPNYTVVGADQQTLPNPLPMSGIASFTLATPIAVTGGEALGLYTNSNTGVACYWQGGSTSPNDTLRAIDEPMAPAAGQSLSPLSASPPTFALNVAATVQSVFDPGVSTTTGPAGATVGKPALLLSSVTNSGPGSAPITFTDTVPTGLTIGSEAVGSGSCSVTGQQVSCTITGLASGGTAPVIIVVTPTAAGSYTNNVTVAPVGGDVDTNPANDTTATTLAVAPVPPPPSCTVPALAGTPLGVAKRVLVLLNCKAGAVTRASSKTVAKGDVIKTTPRAGVYANDKVIALVVSSGPPKKKRRRRHR
jgi:hypothetical protein